MQRPFPADEEMVKNHPQSNEGTNEKIKNIVDGKEEVFEGKDYSNAETVLKEGISESGGKIKVESSTQIEEEIQLPKEKIKNPFQQLSELSILRGDTTGKVTREQGSWVSADKGTLKDWERITSVNNDQENPLPGSQKTKKTVSPEHPDVVGSIGSELVNNLMPEEKHNYRLKAEVTDYVSRRDEMRKWWLEKMKPSFGTGAGAQFGVKSQPRNAAIDQAMMMRQYGPAHRPSTTEEWETHLSWAHRRKYFRTIEYQPRWIRYSKAAITTGILFTWYMKFLSTNYLEDHKKDQSYRYSKVHVVDESMTDPYDNFFFFFFFLINKLLLLFLI